jgi:hypothetical protein
MIPVVKVEPSLAFAILPPEDFDAAPSDASTRQVIAEQIRKSPGNASWGRRSRLHVGKCNEAGRVVAMAHLAMQSGDWLVTIHVKSRTEAEE